MANPIAKQTRRLITLVDGSVNYEITTQITNKGDLPYKEVFVFSIENAVSPQTDVFVKVATPRELRLISDAVYVKGDLTDLIYVSGEPFVSVANVDDLTTLPRDRTVAVQQGKTQYLGDTLIKTYDNITTADAAYKEILARLSDLTTQWTAQSTDFSTMSLTPPYTNYTLPQTAISVQEEEIAAYNTAVSNREAAELTRDTAQTALDAAKAADATTRATYDILAYDVAFLENARALVSLMSDPTPITVKDFVLGRAGYTSDQTTYEYLLIQKRASLATYQALLVSSQQTINTATRTLLDAQAAVDLAVTAESDALAAVRAVCPTFTP